MNEAHGAVSDGYAPDGDAPGRLLTIGFDSRRGSLVTATSLRRRPDHTHHSPPGALESEFAVRLPERHWAVVGASGMRAEVDG